MHSTRDHEQVDVFEHRDNLAGDDDDRDDRVGAIDRIRNDINRVKLLRSQTNPDRALRAPADAASDVESGTEPGEEILSKL